MELVNKLFQQVSRLVSKPEPSTDIGPTISHSDVWALTYSSISLRCNNSFNAYLATLFLLNRWYGVIQCTVIAFAIRNWGEPQKAGVQQR